MENNINVRTKDVEDTHNKLRNILIDYNNPEWGDCIIDEICEVFNYKKTPNEE